MPRSRRYTVAFLALLAAGPALCQGDASLIDDADLVWLGDTLTGPDELPDPYARLNAAFGPDSTRFCDGAPCSGWVEDRYSDGTLRHRGYYGEGHLITYRNFHPNGQVEREFKLKDNTRSMLRTFYDSGVLRSETHYVEGNSRTFTEYYTTGQVRYTEEKHTDLPCYLVMDLFAPDGKAVSTLHLVDRKRMIFEQQEYWPNGQLRASGRSQFNTTRYDQQRIGSWTYRDDGGRAVREEHYVDGKVHETAEMR